MKTIKLPKKATVKCHEKSEEVKLKWKVNENMSGWHADFTLPGFVKKQDIELFDEIGEHSSLWFEADGNFLTVNFYAEDMTGRAYIYL